MAKSITKIEGEIDGAFEAQFGFDINTTSNVSEWIILRGLVSQVLFIIYMFFETFKTEVSVLAQSTEFGNKYWWIKNIKAFQFGDDLLELDGKLYYQTIDPTKQIIKRVAVPETFRSGILVVQIKVAKITAGVSAPLSAEEKTALIAYVNDIKPAGVSTEVVSIAADEVKVNETIYYDGKLEPVAFAAKMLQARKDFLASIEFDGRFNLNLYRDALEAISGPGSVNIHSVEIRPNGGAYSSVGFDYGATSGHYKLIDADCVIVNIPV